MSISVVSLDLWGTLITYGDRAAEHAWRLREFHLVLSEHGHHVDADQLATAVQSVREELFEQQREHGDQVSGQEQITRMLSRLDINAPRVVDLLMIPHTHAVLRACPELLPGARELAQWVRRSGRTAVLTSNTIATPGSVTRLLLQQVGLAGLFDHELFSGELQVAKPRPEVFQAIADRTGGEPGQIVHVGNSWRTDVRAALGAGCRAIWFNPAAKPSRPEAPDVQRLGAVPALVEQLADDRVASSSTRLNEVVAALPGSAGTEEERL